VVLAAAGLAVEKGVKEAGLQRAGVHDLRHLAATIMVAAGMPLPIVSKTERHSTVSIASDAYSHMMEMALAAVDAMADALPPRRRRLRPLAALARCSTGRAEAAADGAAAAARSRRTRTDELIA
jgi:hypothetical protein